MHAKTAAARETRGEREQKRHNAESGPFFVEGAGWKKEIRRWLGKQRDQQIEGQRGPWRVRETDKREKKQNTEAKVAIRISSISGLSESLCVF